MSVFTTAILQVPNPPVELGAVAVWIITVQSMVVGGLFLALMREIAGRRDDIERHKSQVAAAVADNRAQFILVLDQYERRCDKARLEDRESQRELVNLITRNLEQRDGLLERLTVAVEKFAAPPPQQQQARR